MLNPWSSMMGTLVGPGLCGRQWPLSAPSSYPVWVLQWLKPPDVFTAVSSPVGPAVYWGLLLQLPGVVLTQDCAVCEDIPCCRACLLIAPSGSELGQEAHATSLWT